MRAPKLLFIYAKAAEINLNFTVKIFRETISFPC